MFGLTLCVLVVTLRLWQADLHAPVFSYGGDALLHLELTKSILDHGWYLHSPALGAPGQFDGREFTSVDVLAGLVIKFLGWFTHNPALLNNVFYLGTYPLVSLGTFFVGRRLGLSAGPAALAGLLYAFLPYHAYRNTGHLYLSAYYVVPPTVLLAWWVASGRLFEEGGHKRPRRLWWGALTCLVMSLEGVYYPFFAGLLLGVASAVALCARRDRRHALAGAGLAALLAAGMLACLLPTLGRMHRYQGPLASQRVFGETETYGLKVAQMVLPMDGHRWRPFKLLRRRYRQAAPLINENTGASLGLVGAAGFLALLGRTLLRPVRPTGQREADADAETTGALWLNERRRMLDVFGVFNATLLLYGLIGGFGVLFAFFVSPQLRSLNRISLFLALFSLLAVAAWLDAWFFRPGSSGGRRRAGWVVLALLLAAGCWDQTPRAEPEGYAAVAADYHQDAAFFRQVAAAVPPGGMICQLPYAAFPEAGGVGRMEDYAPFRGDLHTHGLRWTYGAMRGSPADRWQRAVLTLPAGELVQRLSLAGFAGIVFEREGYPDGDTSVEGKFRALLGEPAAERDRRVFWSLTNYTQALRATMTPEQWRQTQAAALSVDSPGGPL